ncbi:MAG TPA: tetratricopeptide repeat protein [Candidatus Marinimicrobia bacterium]|nr:tetratricopeptide repeat protein [Candidatus Neomarinimicrobiota bacterium]
MKALRISSVLMLLTLVVGSIIFNISCQSVEMTSAKVYLQQDNVDAAEEQLLLALEKEPNNPEVPFLLATGVYLRKKEWENVKLYLDKTLEIDSSYSKKVQDVRKHVWNEIHNEGASYFNEALNAILKIEKDSLLSEAAKSFEKALAFDNKEAPTYNGLIKCYYLLGDTEKVIQVGEKALKNGVFDKDVFFYYSQMLWAKGKQDVVLKKLDEALVEHPDIMELQMLRIQFLADLGRDDEALVYAQKLAEQYPDDMDVKFVLAQIYARTGKLEEAKVEYQKILAENPDDIDVLQRIAKAYFDSKDWPMAESYARKIIELAPDDPFGYEVLWKCLYNQGKRQEAEKYRAIEKSLRE